MSSFAAPLDRLVREHFPDKPAGCYLDTASIGLVPTCVGPAVADCYHALALGTGGSARWRPVVENTLQILAGEFGVEETEIAFMASTGEAMNAIARAVDWHQGDEVLVLRDEFPTVVLPWLGLGDAIHVVQIAPQPDDDRLGALVAAIRDRTRVVAVSHVNPFTGTAVDLAALGEACAKVGALLVCDGAQAAGSIPVDLHAVDFYIATAYKWLLAGFGCAVVVAKRDTLGRLHPTLLGHGNPPPSPQLTYGHLNLAGVYALGAAATLRRTFGLEEIHDRVAYLTRRLHNEVSDLGFHPAANLTRLGGIVSLGGLSDPSGAVGRLGSSGISVAERRGYLRISPHFYTSDLEVDEFLQDLKHLLDGS